ncbi:MAG: hypothetical protein BA863_03360 [Desulfovibrio sp. S3730MH75]|nr:MAG: hypothetical protein BA863_03360 [Desulfovibrio sp. S3730MH75]
MKQMKLISIVVSVLFLILVVAPSAYAGMPKGIMLEPLRLEMKDGVNSRQITVFNQSHDSSISYTIRQVVLRMDEFGNMIAPEKITKREKLALSMVRYSPKVATIPPGKRQVVRVLIRRPPNLPEGEYLSYLSVSPVVPSQKKDLGAADKNEEGAGIKINMYVGVSMPVLIIEGNPASTTKLSDMKLITTKRKKRAVQFYIERSGKASSFVRVEVYGTKDGKEELIARDTRVVTYVNLKKRIEEINLVKDAQSFSGGPVTVKMYDCVTRDLLDTFQFNL